jgi:hypothetical protein
MTRDTTDVAVVGAGPAGCVFATRMAQLGFDVCLVERMRFPRPHLGESLSPGVMPLLASMGSAAVVEAAGFPRVSAVSTNWDGAEAVRHDPRAEGMLVDRGVFDAALLARAEAVGVRVLPWGALGACLAANLACVGGLLYVLRRRHEYAFLALVAAAPVMALALFVLPLAPTLNTIRLVGALFSERFLYLPAAALALAATWALTRWVAGVQAERITQAVLGVFLLIFAGLTVSRVNCRSGTKASISSFATTSCTSRGLRGNWARSRAATSRPSTMPNPADSKHRAAGWPSSATSMSMTPSAPPIVPTPAPQGWRPMSRKRRSGS